jgi:hypothetical protein
MGVCSTTRNKVSCSSRTVITNRSHTTNSDRKDNTSLIWTPLNGFRWSTYEQIVKLRQYLNVNKSGRLIKLHNPRENVWVQIEYPYLHYAVIMDNHGSIPGTPMAWYLVYIVLRVYCPECMLYIGHEALLVLCTWCILYSLHIGFSLCST